MKSALALVPLFIVVLSSFARGDMFGSGANSFNIEFVAIGNPNNVADLTDTGAPNPLGAVDHFYRIAKYEVSAAVIDKANLLSSAAGSSLGISHTSTTNTDTAARGIDWYEAAKFVSWLNTSTGNVPAYKFDGSGNVALWEPSDVGYDPTNEQRNSLAKYFLPSEGEWYKAAYYDPQLGRYYEYATGSDTVPTSVSGGTAAGTAVYNRGASGPAVIANAGGLSPYGTMAQEGNVWEWLEDPVEFEPDHRYYRGDAWHNAELSHTRFETNAGINGTLGIRVASVVPEPNTIPFAGLAALAGGRARRRRSRG